MKLIHTQDAVSHVLCHDITEIVRGKTKGARFKKGHIVTAEDIPVLLKLGKDNLYVWEKQENMLHEDEAAEILAAVCLNEHIEKTAPSEGKISLTAGIDGLFRVDAARLLAVNSLENIMIATRHTNTPVKKGDILAGTRIIPLVIEKAALENARTICVNAPLFELLPYRSLRAVIITTGNEVFHHRIADDFTPVVRQKLESYGITVVGHEIVDDNKAHIKAAIQDALAKQKSAGDVFIVCTGGMSVDPDDNTPGAIAECISLPDKDGKAGTLVTYGSPVLPGAMFALGYFADGTPIAGLPACVMFAKTTVFDIILPQIVAGVPVTKRSIAALGHGGLCLNCPTCVWPSCGFGKSGESA